ncbi:MAG: polyprenol monophosphomannose synthase [Gemmatimonadaceae bacterium]
MPERALVVIPTYNERDNISRIIDAVLATDASLDILVVDDGSPDGTGGTVAAIASVNDRVHVIRRSGKLGLGTAYIAGFKWALERNYAHVFQMDADFSHDPAYIPEFFKAIGSNDVVVGSRYRDGRANVVNWPVSRLLLSYFANVYARRVTGLPVWDSTAGFKCWRRKVLETIQLNDVKSNGYAFQIEMIFRAWKHGFRIAEIPIVFVDRLEGESKMSKKIVREGIWMVWRLRWWAMLNRIPRVASDGSRRATDADKAA